MRGNICEKDMLIKTIFIYRCVGLILFMSNIPYKVQAVIIPTNETGENMAKFVLTGIAINVIGRANDEYACIGNYLRMQESWCRALSDAHESVREYFDYGLPKKYHSVDDLGKMLGNAGEKLNLDLLCEVSLPQKQHLYLPGDTVVEFYRAISSE